MELRKGGEGSIGEWWVQLWAAEELVLWNQDDVDFSERYPGVVRFGGNGGGDDFAFDRGTGQVLLIPMISEREDWIVLGATLTEAFQRFERNDVFVRPKG